MAQRVTLQHVAERAGVSKTTASFVLTGRRDMRISAEAEERVMRAARELDYRPNLQARALRTNVSLSVGLVSDVVATEPFAGEMIRGALAAAVSRENLLFIGESQGDEAVETSLVRSMNDRGVGSFVYASMYTREVRLPDSLSSHPTVLLNCLPEEGSRVVPAVVPDEHQGGVVAAQVLLDAGHRDAIHIVGEVPAEKIAARERMAGFTEVFGAAGIRLGGVTECLWWPEPAYDATSALLGSGARPTALICLNDRVAMGVYQALADHGLSVPGDVSVVSFDDSDLARWLRPALTSVAIPHVELGRRAVELLLDKAEPEVHQVGMPLRQRGSVAAPAHQRHSR